MGKLTPRAVLSALTILAAACGGGNGSAPAAVEDASLAASDGGAVEATTGSTGDGLIAFENGPLLTFHMLGGDVEHQVPLEGSRNVSISDDGSAAVFVQGGPGFTGPLRLADTEDGSITELGVEGMTPELSPDGKQVVYASGDPMSGEPVVLALVEIGGGSRELGPAGWSPAWSPDGERIAFIAWDGGGLRVVDADGSNERPLDADDAGPVHSIDRSPDGSRIVLEAGEHEPDASGRARTDVWVIDADGSGLQRLTPEDGPGGASPDWSPDGDRIVYVEWQESDDVGPEGGESYTPQLVVIDAAGGSPEPLDMIGTNPAWIAGRS